MSYDEVGTGRNGATSEPPHGGGLSTHEMRQYPEERSGKRTFSKGVAVPTAQSEQDDTPDFADARWRPRGKNNTETLYTVENR